jgi:hypothetical protein
VSTELLVRKVYKAMMAQQALKVHLVLTGPWVQQEQMVL